MSFFKGNRHMYPDKEANWASSGPVRPTFQPEPLEPRVLLAADLSYAAGPDQALDLTLRLGDDASGQPVVEIVDNASLTICAEQPLAEMSAVNIVGSDLDDRLRVDLSLPIGVPISFAGGTGTDSVELVGVTDAACEFTDDGSVSVTDATGIVATLQGVEVVLENGAPLTPAPPAAGNLLAASGALDARLAELADGLDGALVSIRDILKSDLLSKTFPLIGTQLQTAADFIEDFRTSMVAALDAIPTAYDVTDALRETLGDSGLGLLGQAGVVLDESVDDTYFWKVDLEQELVNRDVDLALDVGLPGLDLNVDGSLLFKLGWKFDFTFGLNGESGFFFCTDTVPGVAFDTADSASVDFEVSVQSDDATGSVGSGRLGFLKLDVCDSGSRVGGGDDGAPVFAIDLSGGTDGQLFEDDLESLDLSVETSATANVDLGLVASVGGNAVFPSMSAEFVLDWVITEPENGAGLTVEFNDVSVNLGSFLSDMVYDIFAQVQRVLAPLNSTLNSDLIGDQSILELILAPIPGISYLQGEDTNFLDLLRLCHVDIPESVDTAIQAMIDILGMYDSLEKQIASDPNFGSDIDIAFGSFTIVGPQLLEEENDSADLIVQDEEPATTDWIEQLEESDLSLPEFTDLVGESDAQDPAKAEFSFPFMEDADSIFSLLLGRTTKFDGSPIDFFEFDVPTISLEGELEHFVPFPPLPIIGIWLKGKLGLEIELGFGYDSMGLEAFNAGGFKDPTALFEGFYVSDNVEGDEDRPEITLSATVGASLGAAIDFAGIEGDLVATLEFNLKDPDDDGKVRVSELDRLWSWGKEYFSKEFMGTGLGENLGALMAPLGLFDFGGAVEFQLYLYADIGWWEPEWHIVDPPLTLISFDFGVPDPPPDYDSGPVGDPREEPDVKPEYFDVGWLRSKAVEAGKTAEDTWKAQLDDEYRKRYPDAVNVAVNIEEISTQYLPLVIGSQGGIANAEDVEATQEVFVHCHATINVTRIVTVGIGEDAKAESQTTPFSEEKSVRGTFKDRRTVSKVKVVGVDADEGIELSGILSPSEIDARGGNDTVNLSPSDGGRSPSSGAALIDGGEGDDVITGGSKADVIYGRGGTDTIYGRAGADLIDGGDGDDLIYGEEENDVIRGGPGIDTIEGGTGLDLLSGEDGDDTVRGGADDDIIEGGSGGDNLFGDGGRDVLVGEEGPDVVHGGAEDDIVLGESGADHLYGDDGADLLLGGDDADSLINGGAGNDLIYGDSARIGVAITFIETPADGSDTIDGGAGVDTIYGGQGDDVIHGGTGNDVIYGGKGGDFIWGDENDDELRGEEGTDTIHGSDGNDFIVGGVDTDTLCGDNGMDVIRGEEQGDFLYGGGDGDYIYGEGGDDYIEGNGGEDYIEGNEGNDSIHGNSGVDVIHGNSGADTVWGDEQGDLIYGEAGSDVLLGGAGDDLICGEDGDDVLIGDDGSVDGAFAQADVHESDGVDRLYGQAGEDKILGGGSGDFLYGDTNPDGLPNSTPGRDIIVGDGGEIAYAGTPFAFDSVTRLAATSTTGGADVLCGNEGNDILLGGAAGDTIEGSTGNDILIGDNGSINVSTATIESVVTIGCGSDTVYGQEGEDKILGGGGGDFLYGDAQGSGVDASGKRDIILGDGGRISYSGQRSSFDDVTRVTSRGETSGGPDTIEGNDGDDILVGGGGSDGGEDAPRGIQGNAGNDTILGDNGEVVLARGGLVRIDTTGEPSGGSDRIEGGTGDDIIVGGGNSTADVINGNEGCDILLGDNGLVDFGQDGDIGTLDLIRAALDGVGSGDGLSGDGERDVIFGGTAADTISGGDGEDILLGDNGDVALAAPQAAQGQIIVRGGAVRHIYTTDVTELTGGADVLQGNTGDDIMLGGVNGGPDVLSGDEGDDVLIGDNGELDFAADGLWATLDLVRSFPDGRGGADVIAGNWGADVAFGGSGNDVIYGDNVDGTAGASDGGDILIGDNAWIVLLDVPGNLFVAGNAVRRIGTADVCEATGGADLIAGNAGSDVIMGGVNGLSRDTNAAVEDVLYGDRNEVTPSSTLVDGDDVLLGDGGELDFAFGADNDLCTLDYVASYCDGLGGKDRISGNAGSDLVIGGSGGDEIHGDARAATAGARDGRDILFGDNAAVFLLGAGERSQRSVLCTGVDRIVTTDNREETGDADVIAGNAGDDIVLGGVNGVSGGIDLLYGDAVAPGAYDGADILVGDNGEICYALYDTDRTTIDLIRTLTYNGDGTNVLGGTDRIFGNAGGDKALGGSGADIIIGDNSEAVAYSGSADVRGADPGEDILLGDQAQIVFADGSVAFVVTTDVTESDGGADLIEGNDGDDVIMGGVGGDALIGEAQTPALVFAAGRDVLLGDEGRIRYDAAETEALALLTDGKVVYGDGLPTTLDLIETCFTGEEFGHADGMALGGPDALLGNDGADTVVGGTAGDAIYGDVYGRLTFAGSSGPLVVALAAAPHPGTDALVGDGGRMTFHDGSLVILQTIEPAQGGSDTIEGNDLGDIIMGGMGSDELFGEAAETGLVLIGSAGADWILGDNGRFDYVLATDTVPAGLPGSDRIVTLDPDPSSLDRVCTTDPTLGGNDVIYGNGGSDVIFGGTGADAIRGDTDDAASGPDGLDGMDLLFGDHGKTYPASSVGGIIGVDGSLFFSIDTQAAHMGAGDVMFGNGDDDIMIGGQGDDVLIGGTGDDDMIGGHNVPGGQDELDSMPLADCLAIIPSTLADLNPADVNEVNDVLFGGAGDDVMAGDNAAILRQTCDLTGRFRTVGQNGLAYAMVTENLQGLAVTDVGFRANVTGDPRSNPALKLVRMVYLFDHRDAIQKTAAANPDDPRPFGNDIMAGGSDDDTLFGQFGDDVMQGDGAIELIVPAKPDHLFDRFNPAQGADPSFDIRNVVVRESLAFGTASTLRCAVFQASSDGDDYIEGNGGNDRVYGNLGQDDIIGGSSALWGLSSVTPLADGVAAGDFERADGADLLYGGAGNPVRLDRNDFIGSGENGPAADDPHVGLHERHARDADCILGDNGTIYRLVDPAGGYCTFSYDQSSAYEDRGALRIVVRVVELLDYGYTYGPENTPGSLAFIAVGAGDLIYGESGDDVIHGMTGDDVIFGNSEDDDLYGEEGCDWLAGGTGDDGILGDDGLIFTSRNDANSEPLYGISGLVLDGKDAQVDREISTPGKIQRAIINVEGALKKTVDLLAFDAAMTFGTANGASGFDDIIYGGLGDDWLHGGAGDDAISGGEALPPYYSGEGFGFEFVNRLLQLEQAAPVRIDPAAVLHPEPFWFGCAPYNPGNILRYEGNTIANSDEDPHGKTKQEFALYDEFNPLRKIMLDAQGVAVDNVAAAVIDFLLNFNEDEGPLGRWYLGDGTAMRTDGDDRIFGDLGHDWIVGGTGRDDLYGGRGDDLLNMDDNHDSVPGSLDNTQSDEYQAYADIAYGGGGRDVLILNTGADRAIDWVGEFNSYIVAFSPFGAFQISRTLQPQLVEFLIDLACSDGADTTAPDNARFAAQKMLDVRVSAPDPLKNGEPYGELGLILQQDYDWFSQTGAPNDPQAGNLQGKREIMRRELFTDTNTSNLAFAVADGTWTLAEGRYKAVPLALREDAVSLYHLDQVQPNYMEVLATVSVDKDLAGKKSNAYVIFDYQDATNFKFAGIDVGLNKLRIGHRTAEGWIVDAQVNIRLSAARDYNLLLALNGTVATVRTGLATSVSFDFRGPLNGGYIGVGTDNSVARFDNFQVQKLPSADSFEYEYDAAQGLPFVAQTGAWAVENGSYVGSSTGDAPALATWSVDVAPWARLDFEASIQTDAIAGFVFDYSSPQDFKFVVLDAQTGELVIGHRTLKGWFIDTQMCADVEADTSYELGISLLGTSVSVTLNGTAVIGHVFNSLLNDGQLGLLSLGGESLFDDFAISGNDPMFGGTAA